MVAFAAAGCSVDDTPSVRAAGGKGGTTTSATGSTSTTAVTSSGSSGAGGSSSATGGAAGAEVAGAGGWAGEGGDGGSSGAGGTPEDAGDPCVVGTGPTQLPFAVDKYFIASGWMQASLIHQDTSCTYPSPPIADGGSSWDEGGVDARPLPDSKCWTITYTPTGPSDWAGVDWQYPANNWGTADGLVIPPGATRVTFVAWGDAGGEKVSFNVGYGPTSTDRFGASAADRLLTTLPTPFSIDVAGIYTCHSVRMGFGWIAGGGTTITFHIADIRWE